jgi:hypothetical protein
MPEVRPRTKAARDEQLDGSLQGGLVAYEKIRLFPEDYHI